LILSVSRVTQVLVDPLRRQLPMASLLATRIRAPGQLLLRPESR